MIKLGMDAHARQMIVVRKIGDITPQSPQVLSKERRLAWVEQMIGAGAVMHSCYVTLMGCALHRKLLARDACYAIVVPQNFAGRKKQKGDDYWRPVPFFVFWPGQQILPRRNRR